MSSYPPPPVTPVAATEPEGAGQPRPLDLSGLTGLSSLSSLSHAAPQIHPAYGSPVDGRSVTPPLAASPTSASRVAAVAAAAAAAAAAHHGFQALQAAVATPPAGSPPRDQSPLMPMPMPPYSPAVSTFVRDDGQMAPRLSPGRNPKMTRLRRACDMCSSRKVKCDEAQPCRPCTDLGVECTFNRQMKRRGPPNKHAEAAKATKRPQIGIGPHLSPGPQHAAATLMTIAGASTGLDAESIAPWQVVFLLVDDYFTYIHPLLPIPHEPTFRSSLSQREDRTNPDFLALLASMVGILVASFPRTARLHLKDQSEAERIPKAISLVRRCREVAMDARGARFYAKDPVSVHDVATSYLLGLSAAHTMEHHLCRRYYGETINFLRDLGYHTMPRQAPANLVDYELGKRLFWLLFVDTRSMIQFGSPVGEAVVPPPTHDEPYPELPSEMDDQFIEPQRYLGQPGGSLSLLTSLNYRIKIYLTMNSLVSTELCYGLCSFDYSQQKNVFRDALLAARACLDGLPGEITSDTADTDAPAPSRVDLFNVQDHGYQYQPPAYPALQPPSDLRHVIDAQPDRRRLLQLDIQKADLHLSQLATRAYYVGRYLSIRNPAREDAMRSQPFNQQASTPDSDSKAVAAAAVQAVQAQAAAEHDDPHVDALMTSERALVADALLDILATLRQHNLEPNRASLVAKIRSAAATVDIESEDVADGSGVSRDRIYLRSFFDLLLKLEPTAGMAVRDDEEEVRLWGSLRRLQKEFGTKGGVCGTGSGSESGSESGTAGGRAHGMNAWAGGRLLV